MHSFKPLAFLFYVLYIFSHLSPLARASGLRTMHDSLEARYSHAHSLGENYHFDARDGWEAVNVTNLRYKYRRSHLDYSGSNHEDNAHHAYSLNAWDLEKRGTKTTSFNPSSKQKGRPKSKSKAGSKGFKKPASKPHSGSSAKSVSSAAGITSSVKAILGSLKGKGKAEPVTITWYTGHDLENPSCWPNPSWAPTDASFACALTAEGWTTRPKCFKFIELCNSPKKCVFVRVVDSCAGCAKGSKHVDLTQAAFKALASLDDGTLQVQMRQATEPDGWLEHLWGPKH